MNVTPAASRASDPASPADIAGFKNEVTSPVNPAGSSSHEFLPPVLNRIVAVDRHGCTTLLVLYATPSAPGKCVHIGAQVQVRNAAKQAPKAFAGFAMDLPAWVLHLAAPLFLHQDQGFLHFQQQQLFAKAGYAFGRFDALNTSLTASVPAFYGAVNMPNIHDRGIAQLRRWIAGAGNGGPKWGGERSHWPLAKAIASTALLSTPLRNAELFDVYTQHTKHCTVCQRALKRAKLLRIVLIAALGGLVLQSTWLRSIKAWKAVAAAMLGGAAMAIQKVIGLFYQYDFHHQDNN